MAKKKSTLLTVLGAAAAYGIYSAVTGKGIFNKPHFKEQHDAVSRYVDSHYPRARYTPIEQTQNGWMTIITKSDFSRVMLYLSKAENGVYIFKEAPVYKAKENMG